MDAEKRLNELIDRDEIQRLIIQYCNALDAKDWVGAGGVFTEDQRESRTKGLSNVRQTATTLMPIDHIEHQQHAASNFEISIDGDAASSFCACRTYVVGTRGREPILLIRGITYTDKLVRTSEGWKIKERAHRLIWMTESKTIEGAHVS